MYSTSLKNFLFKRVDNAPIVLFRMFFGGLIVLEVVGAMFTGWIKETLIEPVHHLPFIGFEWLSLPSDPVIVYGYYGLMGIAGAMIMLGAYYQAATLVFAFLWWGCYLMQKVHYNNHYYLLILLAFFMAIIPANRYAAWDVRRKPALKAYTCPQWCILIFILQMAIVFAFAAAAKVYPDWLAGKPISLWFSAKGHYPVIGSLFRTTWFKYFIIYGGIVFDLVIVPLLLWRRTRVFAFGLCLFFHLFNSIVFQIGGFPYLMIALTVFFFPPDVIRKRFFKKKPAADIQPGVVLPRKAGLITGALAVYFIIQLILPLRHLFIPGSVLWTEEGHRMAWHMMLRTKTGHVSFHGRVPETGEIVTIPLHEYFTPLQCRQMAKQPDMIWQAAQILKKIYTEKGYPTMALYATTSVSLNGGPFKPIIDPETDLAHAAWPRFGATPWVLPYE